MPTAASTTSSATSPTAQRARSPRAAATGSTTPLHAILADTWVLAIKTHAAHWNVQGPLFFALHAAFETQYDALIAAVDVLAERLRAVRAKAPTGAQALLAEARIAEAIPAMDGVQLARALAADHRTLAAACAAGAKVADDAEDAATADLLIGRVEEHEKVAWMLEACCC